MSGRIKSGREPLTGVSHEEILAAWPSQEEFAARFQIPLGTLRDWEQSRSEPDQTERAYLEVIASEPEAAPRAHQRKGPA